MKKVKFSIIDAVIVLAVAAVAVVGIKVILPGKGSAAEKSEVTFTVMATKVDSGAKELISSGDEVRISFAEQAYATVTEVVEEPCREAAYFMPESKYKMSTITGKSDVCVTMTCDADVTDTGIMTNNVPIRIGESVVVHDKGYTLTGYIIDINDGEEAE